MTESATERRRHHPISGTHNFRDVGGYRATGGRTRWGKLYRSDALYDVDDAGLVVLAELGLARVIDLRTSHELESSPSRIGDLASRVEHVPIFESLPTTLGAMEMYRWFVDECGAHLARAVRVIADSESEPVLVHCTAGKDRTGLVVALTLLAAGVDRDEVVDDYVATDEYLRGGWHEAYRQRLIDTGVLLARATTAPTIDPAILISETLEHIESRHGSVLGFLDSHGVGEPHVARLRSILVEEAD